MFWLIVIILVLYLISTHPSFFFLLTVLTVCIIILYIMNKKKNRKQDSHPLSDSFLSIHDDSTKPTNNLKPIANLGVSYEFSKVESADQYPLFDATKIPIVKYCQYKVKGKNPLTNRMKTNTVVVRSGVPQNVITKKSGLLEPFTVTPYIEEPSILQTDFAKDLNILYPSGCSKEDLSCLIQRQLDSFFTHYINPDLLKYAADNNIYVSPYSGELYGVYRVFIFLSPKERIIFFLYLIYCGLVKTKARNLYDFPHHNVFYQFLDTISDIEAFSSFIKQHYSDKLAREGTVDRRNKKMSQIYDTVKAYLTDNLPL